MGLLTEYLISRGAVMYVAGCVPDDITVGSCTTGDVITVLNSLLTALAPYNDHIIGVDIIAEANALTPTLSAGAAATFCNTVYAGLTTALPKTFSNTFYAGDSSGHSWMASLSLDYLDFHVYPDLTGYDVTDPVPASVFSYWRSTYPTHDIVFGEYGLTMNHGHDARNNFAFQVLQRIAGSNDNYFRGGFHWAVGGYDTGELAAYQIAHGGTIGANDYGLYGTNYAGQRTDFVNQLRQFTTGASIKRD